MSYVAPGAKNTVVSPPLYFPLAKGIVWYSYTRQNRYMPMIAQKKVSILKMGKTLRGLTAYD